jgi:MFS family permease
VAASFIIQGVCIGALFAYGVFFTIFQTEFNWSRAAISGTTSLAFLTMGAVGILAGRLNDRIGPRVLIMISGTSFGLGFLLISRIQALWQLYLLFGILVGIGLSTHDIITLSTVARWFVTRRGMMSGIVKVGTGIGQLFSPLIATTLIAAYGWRNSCLIIGAVVLVILVAVAQVMRRDPDEMGLLPNGGSDQPGEQRLDKEYGITLKAAAGMGQFRIMCLAEFVIFFCLLTIIVHIVPYATDLGLPLAAAAGVLATIGGVSIIGRIVMGATIDRIAGKRSLIICFVVLLCGLLWLQVAKETWMLYLFAAIYGFAHGGFFTVVSPTLAELFGMGSHGVLFGSVLFSGTIGGSFGPLLAGRIFDVVGSYQIVFLLLTGLALTGLLLITMLQPLKGSQLGR